VTTRSALSADAGLALGLASTAMPFARDGIAQAERWLRVLSLHGETAAILGCLALDGSAGAPGLSDPAPANASDAAPPADPVAEVSMCAGRLAAARQSPYVRTIDILLAVLDVYGSAVEAALQRWGMTGAEVRSLVGRHVRRAGAENTAASARRTATM
jgi:hypothetical protein